MTDFMVPRTGEIILSTGEKHVVVKGIRNVPDEIANDIAATRYGIKPVHELSDDERAEFKLPPAAPDVDEALKVEPEAEKAPEPEHTADDSKARILTSLASKPEADVDAVKA